MKVKDLMTSSPKACTPTSTLADAGSLMWEYDCGALPVVSDGGKVVGLITDRDICMAAVMKNRNLANIAVEEVTSETVFSCKPEDDIHTALKTMQDNKVRRLPIVGSDGTLEGILSMNDIVLKAEDIRDKKISSISFSDVVNTYKSICQHRKQEGQAQAAAGD